jgi:hypothetical protein
MTQAVQKITYAPIYLAGSGNVDIGPATSGNPATTTPGSPGQCKYALRSLVVTNPGASAITVNIIDGTGTTYLAEALSVAAGAALVLPPGPFPYMQTNTLGNQMRVSASGAISGFAVVEATDILYGQ